MDNNIPSHTKIVHRIPCTPRPALFNVQDKLPTLEEMQAWVGGDIEYVWVLFNGQRTPMVVNEVGAGPFGLKQLPVNERATEIYHAWTLSQGKPRPDALVYGHVLVLEGFERDVMYGEEE